MKKLITYLLLAFVILVGNSCQTRPMYDNCGGALYIDIDLVVEDDMFDRMDPPKVFAVAFYNPQTHELLNTAYVPAEGGLVEVGPGDYDILVYNFDTEYVKLRNHNDLYSLEAFTSPVSSDVSRRFNKITSIFETYGSSNQTRGYMDYDLIYEPDHLFSYLVEDFNVPPSTGEDDIIHVLVHPSTIVERYSITIGPVTNGEYIQSAEVFLTGMASGKKVTLRQVSSGPATIWFTIGLNGEMTKFFTYFRTFGRFPGTENDVFLIVHLVDVSGNEYNGEWDVTDQIKDGGHDIVIDDPISITPTPGGGTVPTLNLWNDITTIVPVQ